MAMLALEKLDPLADEERLRYKEAGIRIFHYLLLPTSSPELGGALYQKYIVGCLDHEFTKPFMKEMLTHMNENFEDNDFKAHLTILKMLNNNRELDYKKTWVSDPMFRILHQMVDRFYNDEADADLKAEFESVID